jgi:probable F420-dependent oxidoreductase
MARRPFRFGVQAYRAESGAEWREIARRTEAAGYSALHVADHYLGPGPVLDATGHRAQTIAAIPGMAVAAEVTSTLRIGSRMLCVGYHNPVVLAKQAATLDVLSDGRLELGLGAGWLAGEYEAMGLPFPPAGRRIALLRETIEVVRQHMGEGVVDFDGAQVRAHGFSGVPKPIQRPRPPLMVGGGAPKVLRLAGELADIVSINFNNRGAEIGGDSIATSTAKETKRKVGWVQEGAGDRWADVELEIAAYFVAVRGASPHTAEQLADRIGLEPDEVRQFPHALVGDVDEIVEELQRRREEFGISYVTVGDAHLDAFAPVVARLAGT